MNEKKLLEFIHFLLESNFTTPMRVECRKTETEDFYSATIRNPKGETIFAATLPVDGKQEKELKLKVLLQIISILADYILNNKF